MHIKILHVLFSFNAGGLENGLVNLINHMQPDYFSHVICIIAKGKLFRKRIKQKVRIYELGRRYGNDPLIPFKIASIISRERIDIVHTRNWVSLVDGTIAATVSGIKPMIHSEHGKEVEDTINQPWRRHIAKKICFHYAKAVITVSDALRDELINQNVCNKKKVDCIRNGVDCNRFIVRKAPDKHQLRLKYGIPEGYFILGSVGRLAKIKNYGLLIDILELNKEDRFFGILVGGGPDKNRLESIAKSKSVTDRLLFLGNQKNIEEILSTFDVFINTSTYEGISNTILEAMASGIPIIANKTGGTPEIIEDGVNGFLIENNNTNHFSVAIKKLRDDAELRMSISINSRKTAQNKFSLSEMIQRYEKVYSSVFDKTKR